MARNGDGGLDGGLVMFKQIGKMIWVRVPVADGGVWQSP